MRFRIKDEIRGRVRIHLIQPSMTMKQADILEYALLQHEAVTAVKVYDRSCDVTITYEGSRQEIIRLLQGFRYDKVQTPKEYLENSGRALNREYWEKLVNKIAIYYGKKWFLPCSVRACITACKSISYICKAIGTLAKGKLEVPVLDGTAIGVSVFRGDYGTASSVMFLLEIGGILEEWTHKKSVGDLARSMSLNISKVWLVGENQDVLVSTMSIKEDDLVRVHMGNVIPFDGIVTQGEAMVNQSSLTGESMPVRKVEHGYVYAGTVLEEGELVVQVKEVNGSSKYEKIGAMIEETIKGGKFLEAVAEADTIVFDKTGTLTKAKPVVKQVIPFGDRSEQELLRMAACLEEHFPHSMAKAVVEAAQAQGLEHEEMHSKVEYIVAHGISSMVEGKKVVIGSYHFVFEDEESMIAPDKQALFENLPDEYSHLYMAVEGKLVAVICIEDPLREEAADAVKALKQAGISKVVMMTGDSERTARAIASRVGVDAYFSEVLPEDKAKFVEAEKAAGRKVIMVGDGINDSPALSSADVGIAISDGAQIAREVADVVAGADDLYSIVVLKEISNSLMKRIHGNYRKIVGFNLGLILLGVAGVLQPTTSALLHNTSTLFISLKSMQNLLPDDYEVK